MTRAIYLRADGIDRLTAASGVVRLNRKQQADLLGVPYMSFWHLIQGSRRAASRTVAEVLVGAARFAERYGCEKPAFEDLFEIREIEDEPAAAIAA
jgi:hypothetical protein